MSNQNGMHGTRKHLMVKVVKDDGTEATLDVTTEAFFVALFESLECRYEVLECDGAAEQCVVLRYPFDKNGEAIKDWSKVSIVYNERRRSGYIAACNWTLDRYTMDIEDALREHRAQEEAQKAEERKQREQEREAKRVQEERERKEREAQKERERKEKEKQAALAAKLAAKNGKASANGHKSNGSATPKAAAKPMSRINLDKVAANVKKTIGKPQGKPAAINARAAMQNLKKKRSAIGV